MAKVSRKVMSRMSQDRLIRASVIGQYVFCQRAWWLARVLDVPSTNVGEMNAGTRVHRQHGRRVIWAARARQVGIILLVAALLAFLAFLFTLTRGS